MSKLSTSLKKFKNWRRDLADAIVEYQTWSEQQSAGDGEQDLRVYELIESLKQDKITIALTGEYSRGKTELLNAIFFSEHKQRVLPSAAGRTTMCPTEILYDSKESPYIKLLPIETRKTSVSISEYKNTPIHWTTIHILKVDSVEEVREAFQEITRTKKVHVREAQELGLYESCLQYLNGEVPEDNMLEIPIWRHAIINYPHPLLIQGLNIIDTPGLNALGAEPELTYNILPSAHAILYLLAADTGVTKTDLEVWLNHVNYQASAKSAPKYVVMNKIDTLWDGLSDPELLQQTVDKQVGEIARTLHVNQSDIYPVSAQKALTARVKNDDNLLKQSGIEALEDKLAFEVLPMKYELIRNKVVYEISTRLQNSRDLLDSKLQRVEKQISDLKKIGDSNLDTLQKMLSHMRQEKEKYDKELE
jgi:predicted GTPase